MTLPTRKDDSLTQNFGDMFERFARDFFSPQLDSADVGLSPRVEVQETQAGYRVSAELPGISDKDISLSLRDNSLILEGRRESEDRTGKEGFYRSEFSYGAFSRTIPLESDVDDKNITATFINGILHVDLVKKNDGTERTIMIPINNH